MDLDFSADQEALRDAVRAVLEREAPLSLARGISEGTATSDKLWATMVDLGWPALCVSEAHGGIGLGAIELGLLAEELGRCVAGTPLLATISQFGMLVAACGDAQQQAHWLSRVADGSCIGTIGIAEATASFDPSNTTCTATRNADGTVTLYGTKHFVFEATAATHIACTVLIDGAIGVAIIEGNDLAPGAISAVRTVDATRGHATVTLDGTVVASDAMLRATAPIAIADALQCAVLALALETVGVCSAIFDVTLAYVKQREQFGVPIGSFQAIKHKFADLAIALERARSTCYYAALCVAERDERRNLAVSSAKAAAGDAQRLFAKEGIQLHGGIGYTWEHDMHLYVRRAKSNEQLFGTAAQHRARIAELLIG